MNRLGKGEVQAIYLAKEVGAALLITDDRRARIAATTLGLKCIGLLGLLMIAKKRNLLFSVSAMIAVLEKKGGLYLSDAVKAEAVRIAGE